MIVLLSTLLTSTHYREKLNPQALKKLRYPTKVLKMGNPVHLKYDNNVNTETNKKQKLNKKRTYLLRTEDNTVRVLYDFRLHQ